MGSCQWIEVHQVPLSASFYLSADQSVEFLTDVRGSTLASLSLSESCHPQYRTESPRQTLWVMMNAGFSWDEALFPPTWRTYVSAAAVHRNENCDVIHERSWRMKVHLSPTHHSFYCACCTHNMGPMDIIKRIGEVTHPIMTVTLWSSHLMVWSQTGNCLNDNLKYLIIISLT